MVNAKVKKTRKTDLEIEQATGISRRVHERRNDQINELPTGKLTVTEENKMIYVDEAGRKWRLNPDIAASFHQPTMGVVHAFFHSILDCLIFCVDFPVPNIKFISMNDDNTWSEAICNRYTGELVVDPRYFGTANFCTDCPDGMEKGALSTQEHVKKDVKPHQKYGNKYTHIAKGMDIHYFDNRPLPVILAEPLGGKKAIYVCPENDPNDPKYIPSPPVPKATTTSASASKEEPSKEQKGADN